MTSKDFVPAAEALAEAPSVYLFIKPDKDKSPQVISGTVYNTIEHHFAVSVDLTDDIYKDSPAVGTEISCAAPSDKCAYHFLAIFCGSTKLPDRIWLLSLPEKVERCQARTYVRIPADMPFGFWPQNVFGGWQNAQKADLVDISGGGIGFLTEQPLKPGQHMKIELHELPDIGQFRAEAVVRRAVPFDGSMATTFHVGASLILDRRMRERLIRCIFQMQRKHLERGIKL